MTISGLEALAKRFDLGEQKITNNHNIGLMMAGRHNNEVKILVEVSPSLPPTPSLTLTPAKGRGDLVY